jgi:hypothetical protein
MIVIYNICPSKAVHKNFHEEYQAVLGIFMHHEGHISKRDSKADPKHQKMNNL